MRKYSKMQRYSTYDLTASSSYKQVSRRREELEQEEVLQSGGKDSCIA